MFADIETPRARHWAIPLMAGCVLLAIAWFLDSQIWVMIVGLCGAVLLAWCLVNFVHHVIWVWNTIRNDNRHVDFMLSENFKIEKISQMNPDQLKAYRSGHHVIGVYPSEDGITIDKIADEEVYLYTAWWILVNSTKDNVYPINNFQPGTFHFDMLGNHAVDDYQQARNFHVWLVRYGYAHWGRGSQSASWSRGFNPDEVLRRLQMDRDTYRAKSEE